MNYITAAKNTKKLSETELRYNISGKASWHHQYKDSAWIYIGGLPYDLTEGDIVCVFSQYGEVVNLNLPRDQKTGKSKGFCFLCYEDQRSTILAVDNLNTMKLCGRIIRVDHVQEYKVPKNIDKLDEEALRLLEEGCGPDSSITKSVEAKPFQSNGKPENELGIAKTETHSPKWRLKSPSRSDEMNPRHRNEFYRENDSNGDRFKQRDDSNPSKHIERKDDNEANSYDRKREEKTIRSDKAHQNSSERKRRDERSRDNEKDRSKKYEKFRHEELSKHRNRSRSRDRDRKHRN